MLIHINEQPVPSFALFNLGFRPFFWLSAISAIVLMVLWGLLYSNLLQLSNYYGFIDWHSHEMLFGYATAVIAGFLLTAVRNWTGVDTISKTPLAVLAGIWLAGRLLPFTPVSGWWIAGTNILFLLILILAIAHPIIKARQWHNLIMVAILSALMLAEMLVQGHHLGLLSAGLAPGNSLALYSILMLIQVVTGRVMPFFTRIVIPQTPEISRPILEQALFICLLLLALADILVVNDQLVAVLAAILVLGHCLRIAAWFSLPVLKIPILWVLYAGYAWFIAGFAIKILAGLGLVGNNLAIHAWTIGTIGIITYGMMARVALGHTGREMQPSILVVAGFYLLMFAAVVRVILPLLFMEQYVLWVQLSIVCWVLAFGLFAMVYTRILMGPRADGQPG